MQSENFENHFAFPDGPEIIQMAFGKHFNAYRRVAYLRYIFLFLMGSVIRSHAQNDPSCTFKCANGGRPKARLTNLVGAF